MAEISRDLRVIIATFFISRHSSHPEGLGSDLTALVANSAKVGQLYTVLADQKILIFRVLTDIDTTCSTKLHGHNTACPM